MIIKTLSLKNFRNYRDRAFEFSPKTALIVGPNTAGKTNILEAIYILAAGKSLRANYDKELIQFGSSLSHVSCHLSLDNRQTVLELTLISDEKYENLSRKRFKVNGVSRLMNKFIGNLSAVMFSPEDIELVTDSPSLRRKYLDSVLVQVDQNYRRAVSDYAKVLRRRNRILEGIRNHPSASSRSSLRFEGLGIEGLEFWDEKLLEAGTLVQSDRKGFFGFLEGKLPDVSMSLALDGQQLKMEYLPNLISGRRLEEYREREIAAAQTLVGPHRDDFRFSLADCSSTRPADSPTSEVGPALTLASRWSGRRGRSAAPATLSRMRGGWANTSEVFLGGAIRSDSVGRDLSSFGSRSEQRTAVLALKLAELDFIKEKIGDSPILLLDDIFSELDDAHRKKVLGLLGKQQTILTTTDEKLVGERLRGMEVIRL